MTKPATRRASAGVFPEPEDKRARILAAALELFEKAGFDGVAVPEIARAAGVATGTIYRYFEDKEALVNALYRHWKGVYNAAVLAPVPQVLTPKALFLLYWQRMTAFSRAHPRAARFMDLHHHGAYLDTESRATAGEYLHVAQDFVAEAGANGAIRPLEPAVVVALMWGAAAGLAKFAKDGALDFDTRTAEQTGEALWRAIAVDPNKRGS